MIQRRNSDLDIEERFTRDINRLPEKDLDRIAKAYRQVLESVGEDSNREGLRRTPDRAARAFEFLTQGYRQDLEDLTIYRRLIFHLCLLFVYHSPFVIERFAQLLQEQDTPKTY